MLPPKATLCVRSHTLSLHSTIQPTLYQPVKHAAKDTANSNRPVVVLVRRCLRCRRLGNRGSLATLQHFAAALAGGGQCLLHDTSHTLHKRLARK